MLPSPYNSNSGGKKETHFCEMTKKKKSQKRKWICQGESLPTLLFFSSHPAVKLPRCLTRFPHPTPPIPPTNRDLKGEQRGNFLINRLTPEHSEDHQPLHSPRQRCADQFTSVTKNHESDEKLSRSSHSVQSSRQTESRCLLRPVFHAVDFTVPLAS